ncbi:ATP-binding protein [Lewinella cohaerens]|uniref:ATP-binding protein n=1 Tax=Lewinella cohaerens TaxID=70995 RepID=UPI0003704B64|nr:ATP-binding protein [Lewinella cohaerens]
MKNNHEYHVVGLDGSIIISSLSQNHFEYYANSNSKNDIIKTCKFDGKRKRHGKLTTDSGVIYIISSEKPLVTSTRIFKIYLDIYASILQSLLGKGESFRESFNKNTRRLLHNVRSINAHNIQEIESIIPQSGITDNIFDQIDFVNSQFDQNREKFSASVLRLMKNNLKTKVEINVFDKLLESPIVLSKRDYKISKVLINVLQTFFQDFMDSGTTVKIGATNKRVNLDYETFQVCLYHIFDNASKYMLPNKDLSIRFRDDLGDFLIEIDMISLKIHDAELELIYEEGVSGIEAKKVDKQGQGIGMYLIVSLLKMIDASIEIVRKSQNFSRAFNGGIYENNIFIIRFHGQGLFMK